jgi:hypothetical protein
MRAAVVAFWAVSLLCAACDSTDDASPAPDAAAVTADAAPAGDADVSSDARAPDAAPPVQCPLIAAENQCATDTDCSDDDVCYVPNDGPSPSGQCADDELDQCDTDADCAGRGTGVHLRVPGAHVRRDSGPPVSAGMCGRHLPARRVVRRGSSRCAPTACDAATPCPPDFDCDARGRCDRRPCTEHGDCATCCVNGFCFAAPGTCNYRPQ